MMKISAVIGLILIFWCHQSHHHIFLFINTSPIGLASEEFIPIGGEADAKNTVTGETQTQESLDVGSQSNKADGLNPDSSGLQATEANRKIKSDNRVPLESSNVNIETVNTPSPDLPFHTGVTDGSEKLQNGTRTVESVNRLAEDTSTSNLNSDIGSKSMKGHDIEQIEDLYTPSTLNGQPPLDISLSSTQIAETSDRNHISDHLNDTESAELPPTKVEVSETSEPNSVTTHSPQNEEPIPSFMEWTQIQQQKLHESNLAQGAGGPGQTNGHNGHKTHQANGLQQNKSAQIGIQAVAAKDRKETNAKNFASPDCGAKVIQSNPESQNSNGVLSSSHDEYMLNRCGIPIWFIVELCEPLKIEKVSLGNLELFSSSPKDIEIGISDRYPTRDWTKLGPFTLPDIRGIHSIELPATNASTFGKFLKVNVLSHYGTEHFCPLSLVKVNGISEYEVLESENTHPEEIDATDKEESALYEEPIIMDQTLPTEGIVSTDKSVFGSAKDAVINIVKKAAQVLVKSDSTKDATQLGAGAMNQSSCRSILQCLPNYEVRLREQVLSLLSCNFSDLLPFLSKNSPWCGWDYCHAMFNKHSIGLPWQPEGFYASIFGGPSVLHALCNYHKPLSKDSCDAVLLSRDSASTSNDDVLAEGYINESLKSLPVILGTNYDESKKGKENILPKEPPVSLDKSDNDADAMPAPEVPMNGHVVDTTTNPTHATKENGQAPTLPNTNGDAQQNIVPPSVSAQTPSGIEQDPTASTIAQPSQQNNNNNQQQQQKESVFVRLSNRIKTLERNQSMTSSYLEELSRRFKKQNEENYHINEGNKRFINESKIKFKTLEDLYRFELRSLHRNTDEIRERLFNVQLQRSVLILLCLIQLLGIVSVGVWVKKRFRQLESQLENMSKQESETAIVPVNASTSVPSSHHNNSQHVLPVRKRINSDVGIGSSLNSFDKSKKIKKKKKKLTDIKPVNLKVAGPGPASAPIECHSSMSDRGFKFDYPVPSSTSAYNISVLSNFKENIKPEAKIEPETVPEKRHTLFGASESGIPAGISIGSQSGALLSTKVDSPFSMISSTARTFYPDSSVSTSSRFALLASPSPATTTKPTPFKRSGSLTSLEDRSSMSSYGGGDRTTTAQSITNGHGDSQSQGSNGNGKKKKNKGLKALMPKIFDR